MTSVYPVDPEGKYWFDSEAAENAVRFFGEYLFFTTGEWAGKPFVLAEWQAEIVRQAFGWKRKSDGTRRYRRVIVWVPRKNGKTELAAGIAWLLFVGDAEPGAQVFSIATDKNQASIVFDKSADMLQRSVELQRIVTPFKASLYCPEIRGSFRPLSGIPKGKHGLNMHGLVGDEVHEWAHDRLYKFVHDSAGTRRQPMEFLISTAGEKEGFGWDLWQECQAILSGESTEEDTLVCIFGADAAKDEADPDYWKDPATWRAANPSLGVSLKEEFLESECRKAQRNPRWENDFKRYYLNLWVEQVTRWLPMDCWADCGEPPEMREELRAKREAIIAGEYKPPPRPIGGPAIIVNRDSGRWKKFEQQFAGRRAWGGVDLSSTTDLTCTAWIFPPDKEDGLVTVLPRFYIPRATMKDRVKNEKMPYDRWLSEGAVMATPGNAIDYAQVKADIIRDAERFDVQTVAIDRYNATQFTMDLAAENLDAQLFGQGFVSMSPPSKELEALILSLRLDHGGHPVLTMCARNVGISKDAAENIKPDKVKSTQRIDGIVATVNGLGAWMLSEREPDISEAIASPVII